METALLELKSPRYRALLLRRGCIAYLSVVLAGIREFAGTGGVSSDAAVESSNGEMTRAM